VIAILAFTALPAAAADVPTATVDVKALNVRSGPGTAYAVIGSVALGDTLQVTGRDEAGAWLQVRTPAGATGWVSAPLVTLDGDLSDTPVVAALEGSTAKGSVASGGVIVFQESSGGTIYAVSADGSNMRRLTSGIDPAISPDGKQVAFTRWDGQGSGATGSLWVVNLDGTGERRVMSGARQPKSPSWSADGTKIVIGMQHEGRLKWLCMVNGVPTETDQRVGKRCMPPDPHWSLRLVEVATGEFQDLPVDSHSFGPTWDPVSAWHVVYRGDQGLTSLDVNRDATWPIKPGGAYRGPIFSPDGQRLATTFHQNDHWEVHVLNADGSGQVRLTETPASVLLQATLKGETGRQWNNAAPAWSPDGNRIAFVTDRNGRYELWVMNADGSNQRPLLPAEVASQLTIRYEGNDERMISWR
jgi:TolB protein